MNISFNLFLNQMLPAFEITKLSVELYFLIYA